MEIVGWLEVGPSFGVLGLGSGGRENWGGRSVLGGRAQGPSILRVRKHKLGPCEYFSRAEIPESRNPIEGINISAELTIGNTKEY